MVGCCAHIPSVVWYLGAVQSVNTSGKCLSSILNVKNVPEGVLRRKFSSSILNAKDVSEESDVESVRVSYSMLKMFLKGSDVESVRVPYSMEEWH